MTPVTALAEALRNTDMDEFDTVGEYDAEGHAEAILANLKGFVLVTEEGLAAALYDDGCIRPPQTDHVAHVLAALAESPR